MIFVQKTDLFKSYKAEYSATKMPQLIEVSPAQYLSICGQGDPDGAGFARHVGCLYATAYTLKFMCKITDLDFVVAKLEGLWHFDEAKYGDVPMAITPAAVPRSEWHYRMMIRMPDHITLNQVSLAKQMVIHKKEQPCAADVSLFQMNEGKVVQLLHTGPFSNEPESLALLWDFMAQKGLQRNGPHHEIYLSDIRKTSPDRCRTILREPVM